MQTVRVRLRRPTRVFTFSCSGIPLDRGDACIVRTDRGLEYGTCVLPPEPCSGRNRNRFKMPVVRRASESDTQTLEQIQEDETKARAICVQRIAERELNMKLVDTEYTFDRQKIIFYFTAADRVDFRQLVRDLAQELRTRIELRHIQVRDEAKLVGGLGICGRVLCCATWLREFKPISMKMAKRQNLSLNPTKISGQCGRLLCCLGYENELYEDKKKARTRRQPQEKPPEETARKQADKPAEKEMPTEATTKTEGELVAIEDSVAPQGQAVTTADPQQPQAAPAPKDEATSTTKPDTAPTPKEDPSKAEGKPRRRRRRGRRRRGKSRSQQPTPPSNDAKKQ